MGTSLRRRRAAKEVATARARQLAAVSEQTRAKLDTFVAALQRAGKPPHEIDRLSKLYVERLAALNERAR